MSVRYRDLSVSIEPRENVVALRCRLVNRSREAFRADSGPALGWQILDPESGFFIAEGEWRRLESDLPPGSGTPLELRMAVPAESGPYRILVSPVRDGVGWYYQRGWPLVVIDLVVQDGRAVLQRARVTTRRRLRWEQLPGVLKKLFTLPVLAIWRNRALIRSMARRDILGRYRGSLGDVLWTVLNPLLLMLTYFFVFGVVLQTRFGTDTSSGRFVLYFLAGMLPWLAFSEAVGRSPQVVLEHRNFVKKLVFPVEILPVTQVLAGLVTEGFALLIFAFGLSLARGAVPWTTLWLPVLVIPQLLFTLGLCWFLAGAGAFLRDLGQIIGFLLTLWFFLTPICYPESALPEWALSVLGKNPLFVLVHGYRDIFLEKRAPDFAALWKLWVMAGACFLLGHAWFYKLRRSFADVV